MLSFICRIKRSMCVIRKVFNVLNSNIAFKFFIHFFLTSNESILSWSLWKVINQNFPIDYVTWFKFYSHTLLKAMTACVLPPKYLLQEVQPYMHDMFTKWSFCCHFNTDLPLGLRVKLKIPSDMHKPYLSKSIHSLCTFASQRNKNNVLLTQNIDLCAEAMGICSVCCI